MWVTGFGTYSVTRFVTQMDTLGKKYDQRFKAAGEVSSRLQAEEAAFRDIQVFASLQLYLCVCLRVYLLLLFSIGLVVSVSGMMTFGPWCWVQCKIGWVEYKQGCCGCTGL